MPETRSEALAKAKLFQIRKDDMEQIKGISLDSGEAVTTIVRQLVHESLVRRAQEASDA